MRCRPVKLRCRAVTELWRRAVSQPPGLATAAEVRLDARTYRHSRPSAIACCSQDPPGQWVTPLGLVADQLGRLSDGLHPAELVVLERVSQ